MTESASKNTNRRTPMLLGFCGLITALVMLWSDKLIDVENYVRDSFARAGRKTAIDPRLVLIGIDRQSYEGEIFASEAKNDPVLAALRERFPWSRRVWAALIERLATAGAKTIVIDLVFATEADGDEELHAALEKFGDRVVIGSNFNIERTNRGTNSTLNAPTPTVLTPPSTLPAALDARVGYVNIWPEDDGVFRRARYRLTNKQAHDVVDAPATTVLESLDAHALDKFGERARVPSELQPVLIRFSGPPGGGWRIHPVGDVLTPKNWQVTYTNGAFFRDKLVFIGPTANIFQDFHPTPFRNEMAGPEIHLNIINAALQGEFLRDLAPRGRAGLIAAAGIIAAGLCLFLRQPIKRLVLIIALSIGYLFLAYWLFNQTNRFVLVVPPMLVLLTSGLVAFAYDFTLERLERIKLRHTMGLYFSPRVLEAVLADPGSMLPRRAEVVMLLTDLRNSTPLAEALGPHGMFELLNRIFEAQTSSIMSEEGNLEHFLGDQFLSYWGAPQPQPDAADRAERAAIKLIEGMEKLRTSLSPEIQKLFGYGVALHSGRVLVGNKGSALRLDYGLVGDAVNEAARVEALTKYYGVKLLVSRDTFAQFSEQGARRLVDRVIVKGKSEPVELYECENPCTPSNYRELCQRYKAAYDEYFFGRFTEAQTQFEKLVSDFNDGPSRMLAVRCGELAKMSPVDWKGIWRMEAK